MAAGENRQPAFLAKNPFGQVPVIEDGSLVLCGWTAPEYARECRANNDGAAVAPAFNQKARQADQ